jgi:hypothetical protein
VTAPAVVASAGAYAALDAAYRAALAKTSALVVRILLDRWTSVDPANFAGTSELWLSDGVEAVLAGQRRAVGLANLYAEQTRRLSLPREPLFTPPPARPPSVEQIRTSLEFTGISTTAREVFRVESVRQGETGDPDSADRTAAGRTKQIMDAGITRAGGAAIRLVTAAGRDQLEDLVRADAVAIGWARTTKPGCCYFCAMLASRGRVYKEDSFALSDPKFDDRPGEVHDQKVHDNCGCGLRPIYSPVEPLPDRSEELDALWVESGRQRRRDETAIQAWRRIYEASELFATA